MSHRNDVLRSLVAAGADLILAGHIHQAALSERHEFEVVEGDVRAAVVSIAPGLGQPRPQRLGEARGLHVYEIGPHTLTTDTYIWRGGDVGPHRAQGVPARARPPRPGLLDPRARVIPSAGEAADQHHEQCGDDHADDEGEPAAARWPPR